MAAIFLRSRFVGVIQPHVSLFIWVERSEIMFTNYARTFVPVSLTVWGKLDFDLFMEISDITFISDGMYVKTVLYNNSRGRYFLSI